MTWLDKLHLASNGIRLVMFTLDDLSSALETTGNCKLSADLASLENQLRLSKDILREGINEALAEHCGDPIGDATNMVMAMLTAIKKET